MNATKTAPGAPPPPGINAGDSGEDENLSDDSVCRDQDDAQAFLQPAMSAAASHLTSLRTPATEKAAALQRPGGHGYFDEPQVYGDDDGDGDTTPEATAPSLPQSTSLPLPETQLNGKPVPTLGPAPMTSPRRQSPPSPWKSQQSTKDGKPFSEARGILHAAIEGYGGPPGYGLQPSQARNVGDLEVGHVGQAVLDGHEADVDHVADVGEAIIVAKRRGARQAVIQHAVVRRCPAQQRRF